MDSSYRFAPDMTNYFVLFHLNQLGFGGTEKAILLLARELKKCGLQPFLFFNDERGSLKYWRIKLTDSKRFQQRYEHAYAREQAFKEEFGAEHVFSGSAEDFFEVLKTHQPKILHFNRGESSDFYTQDIHKIDPGIRLIETNIFGKSSSPQYLQRLSKILFVSEWLKNKATWCGQKGVTLYNPIALPQTQASLRERLSIPVGAKVIGMMGRPDLGSDEFVQKAIEPLLNEVIHGNQTHIISLGLVPGFRNLQHPNLHLLAPTTDEIELSRFYNTIDIFAHRRTEGETFGMIIAEAMMHGKPVVSHLSAVDNAQVEVIGDPQWLTSFDDYQSYQEKLRALLSHPAFYKSESVRVKARAEKLFQPEQIAQQLIAHYHSVL